MRIIFAGTPDFAVAPLEALIAKKHNILAVYTQPDRPAGRGKTLTPPPVKQVALANNIEVFQPDTLKTREQENQIKLLEPDVMVVVAYGMLLPQNILDTPKYGCINIHASLLPRWRGAAPIQRAIEAGDNQTGVSIMQMEAGLDTGPVFNISSTDILPTDTSQTLHDRLSDIGATAICETLEQIEQNSITPSPQDNNQANYAKKITKQEAQINWLLSAQQIDNKIRAFIPWPICQTAHMGNRLRITGTLLSDSKHNSKPGTVLNITDQGIEIACGQGSIFLTEIQRDGGKKMGHQQFINGYSIKPGEILA